MLTGISTASLFQRFSTEDAVKQFNINKVNACEVFLESFCEYNKKFGKLINKLKGDVKIHSIHTLTTQFEPQLYSVNVRAQKDSFKFLEDTLKCAEKMGASYYTFHGGARFKKTPMVIDFDRVSKITQSIIDLCGKYGVKLAYENVHWCYYNYIGFFKTLKGLTKGLKGTLDIKQARQCGVDHNLFLKEMGEDIVTVHLSDVDENGKMCLPGKGITDFSDLFKRLNDVGFNGALLLEVYKNDFNDLSELYDSLDYVNELAYKIFK